VGMIDEAGFEGIPVLYSIHSFPKLTLLDIIEGAENLNFLLVGRLIEVTSSCKLGNVLDVFHQQYDIFLK
jgi:hypothetical protein